MVRCVLLSLLRRQAEKLSGLHQVPSGGTLKFPTCILTASSSSNIPHISHSILFFNFILGVKVSSVWCNVLNAIQQERCPAPSGSDTFIQNFHPQYRWCSGWGWHQNSVRQEGRDGGVLVRTVVLSFALGSHPPTNHAVSHHLPKSYTFFLAQLKPCFPPWNGLWIFYSQIQQMVPLCHYLALSCKTLSNYFTCIRLVSLSGIYILYKIKSVRLMDR